MFSKIKSQSASLEPRHSLLILTAILFLGAVLRFYRLNSIGLWFDEIMTVYRSNSDLGRVIASTTDTHFPPGYYLMMLGWLKLVGLSDFTLRVPSVIFSILSIYYVYRLAKEMFGEKIGLCAAFFVSISAYDINYAQDAKMYSICWCFATASLFYLLRYTRTEHKGNLIAYFFINLVSIYTSYLTFLFLAFQFLLFFSLTPRRLWKTGLRCFAGIGLAFMPWARFFLHFVAHPDGLTWIPRFMDRHPSYFLTSMNWILGNFFSLSGWLFVWMDLIVFALLFSSLRASSPFRKNVSILWLHLLFISLVLLTRFSNLPLTVERYFGFAHIPILILIAVGLNLYTEKWRRALGALYIATSLGTLGFAYYGQGAKIDRQDWRELIGDLKSEFKTGDTLATWPNTQVLDDTFTLYSHQKFSFLEISESDLSSAKLKSLWIISMYGMMPHDLSAYNLTEEKAYTGELKLLHYEAVR